MPELPEVETVKEILKTQVLNSPILDVHIYYENLLENISINEFKQLVVNQKINDITRKGKYLIFILDRGSLIVHLRMEGKFFLKDINSPRLPHEHLEFVFKDFVLRYHDTRKFGRFVYLETTYIDEITQYKALKKLGVDGNLPQDFDYVYNQIKRSNLPIKTLLLDQSIIAGLGNIYVDEVLYKSNIHPLRIGKTISNEECKRIIKNSKIVLDEAIKQGGTTIRSYTSSLGVTGRFQVMLGVHTREFENCGVCGHTIKKIFVGSRGTYYCPHCQKDLKEKHIIGITGTIGSGKTALTDYLKELGYPVIDADVINRELLNPNYKYYDLIKSDLMKYFNNCFVDEQIDRRLLRNVIFENQELRTKLQDILYPVIKKIIVKEIEQYFCDIMNNAKFIFVSAPLLLESKFDELCDEVIIVTSDKDVQISRLMNRDNISYEEAVNAINLRYNLNKLINIAKLHHFAPYIIDNSKDLENLKFKAREVLKQMEDQYVN